MTFAYPNGRPRIDRASIRPFFQTELGEHWRITGMPEPSSRKARFLLHLNRSFWYEAILKKDSFRSATETVPASAMSARFEAESGMITRVRGMLAR